MSESRASIQVATSGTIDRADVCRECKQPMFYHVELDEKPEFMFCGNVDCGAFLRRRDCE